MPRCCPTEINPPNAKQAKVHLERQSKNAVFDNWKKHSRTRCLSIFPDECNVSPAENRENVNPRRRWLDIAHIASETLSLPKRTIFGHFPGLGNGTCSNSSDYLEFSESSDITPVSTRRFFLFSSGFYFRVSDFQMALVHSRRNSKAKIPQVALEKSLVIIRGPSRINVEPG